ncbi:energy-coupling factor transporter ATPase [Halanaerobacter jeridensis]|uniref:ABC transporter ATP-binding protein n=1 Tax=Halanaerobacter jeridensis TaxID=706427 RepID=A0A938XYU2_9FIRM|nr:energy-coupling factor transporter ATPase [Halanaerobacter jeridensis]MBM7557805.1 energy-coupling factor transport system ATP-binding protein [Halanaerobacter jeridensis]
MPLIKIRDLYHKYETEQDWILEDVNLDIESGDFVAIVGHNGSGKSTLAKMLNGLLTPSRGSVEVAGHLTTKEDEIWDIRRKIGMVFQNPDNQLVANIVEEDVAFGPENLGLDSSEIRQRVDNALSIVDMEEYKRAAPHHLSGGQKQRVAIAGILAMKPDCLVLDEPTAMLDPVGRKKVLSTVHQLNEDLNMTVIYITHFMNEVIKADKIIVMEEGKVVLTGTPAQLFSNLEQLYEYHLDVPQTIELAVKLREAGIDISQEAFEVDRLVKELC